MTSNCRLGGRGGSRHHGRYGRLRFLPAGSFLIASLSSLRHCRACCVKILEWARIAISAAEFPGWSVLERWGAVCRSPGARGWSPREMRGSSRLRGGESCLCSPVHSSWNVSCQPSSAVGSHRTGSRTGILNNYSCGLQGGWRRLISCDSAASMLGCSQAGPWPRRSCPQLQSQHPSRLATYQQGKSIVLNVLPIVA